MKLDGKYSERVQLPAKAKFGDFWSPTLGNTCHTYTIRYSDSIEFICAIQKTLVYVCMY